MQKLIAESNLLENEKVSWIEFQRALEIFHCLFVLTLTTDDVADEFRHTRVVW